MYMYGRYSNSKIAWISSKVQGCGIGECKQAMTPEQATIKHKQFFSDMF